MQQVDSRTPAIQSADVGNQRRDSQYSTACANFIVAHGTPHISQSYNEIKAYCFARISTSENATAFVAKWLPQIETPEVALRACEREYALHGNYFSSTYTQGMFMEECLRFELKHIERL